jgi:hypothetical protein
VSFVPYVRPDMHPADMQVERLYWSLVVYVNAAGKGSAGIGSGALAYCNTTEDAHELPFFCLSETNGRSRLKALIAYGDGDG